MLKYAGLIFFMTSLFAVDAVADENVDSDKVKKLFIQGNAAFDDGDFNKAAQFFRKAYKYKPTWRLWYNIAQAETAAGRYGLALEAFENYLGKGKDAVPTALSSASLTEIKRLHMLVGVLEVDAPDGTSLMVDYTDRGKKPFKGVIRVAVGEHKVILKYKNDIVLDKTINIAGSVVTKVAAIIPEKVKPDLSETLDDKTNSDNSEVSEVKDISSDNKKFKSKGPLIGGIISAVAAAGGIGLGIGFTVKMAKDVERRDSAVATYVDSGNTDIEAYNKALDVDDDIGTDQTMMIVGYTVGGALAVLSTVLFVLHNKKKKKNKSSVVLFKPSPAGLLMLF